MKTQTLLAILCLFSLPGCMFYYKVRTSPGTDRESISKFLAEDKYIILHGTDSTWHLNGISAGPESFTGFLSVLPDSCKKYKTTKIHGGNRYRRTVAHNERYVLRQVQLYCNDSVPIQIGRMDSVQLAYGQISRTEVYIKAKGRSTASWVIPAILGPVFSFGAFMIILVLAEAEIFPGM